ncbi:unnamed protein product [Spirodela intermedia]|uniref:RING-type domain-containing protein n=1 Tax=Spirodela intermedia TaxID=51605 RepID=A0A7I8IRU4_SPIIN|nr:unnamed protein product [Spirodela intermedia]CAA6659692.1 unnamed protein product [Spirodela intermedia]
MFSGEQDSELTCNVSASRKRSREDLNLLQQQQQLWLAGAIGKVIQEKQPVSGTGPSASFHNSLDNSRLIDSAMSSTSGRSAATAPTPTTSSPAVNPLVQEFLSQLYHQSLEVDTLIRLQNDRLRSGLEETRKRHCGALILAMEEAVLRRLREKEAELETVSRRNAELEEKVWQMTAENQMWFSVARNNEAIVSSLRASLEQALQNANETAPLIAVPQAQDVEEGYGDSDCVAPTLLADDAQSCCNADAKVCDSNAAARETLRELPRKRMCKVCAEQEVSVLLLPCRHLCLCKQCEARLDACPVCNSTKNASLQIFMS